MTEFVKKPDEIVLEADYELALQEINRCLDAAFGSPERDRLEVLTVLVDDYEVKHYPMKNND